MGGFPRPAILQPCHLALEYIGLYVYSSLRPENKACLTLFTILDLLSLFSRINY